MNIAKLFLTTLLFGLLAGLLIDLWKLMQSKKVEYLLNDKSKDYTRWEMSDLSIAAFVALKTPKTVRLDDEFQSVLYAVLSRSERAVSEKIRRLSTLGSEKSDASVADEDMAFLVLSYQDSEALDMFELDLQLSGATKKQIEVLTSYL